MPALAAVVAVTMLCASCAHSPPDHFYTLSGNTDTKAAPMIRLTAPYYIEVAQVEVPEQVARSQMIIGRGPGSIELKEHQRWVAPLDSEIRHALSDELTAQLGAFDVYRVAYPTEQPVYWIGVKVRRFESVLGDGVLIDTVWSVRRSIDEKAMLICQSSEHEAIIKKSETAETDYTALVAAHQRALTRIASSIAAAVRTLAALPADAHTEPAMGCPAIHP